MKKLFIDESGNLGKKDRFFVIAMLTPQRSKRIVNFIKRFIAKNNSITEIKANSLDFVNKQNLLNKLNQANDCGISYIVADKNHIEPRLFSDKNLCYNYLLSFLLKKTIKYSNEDVCVLLDNHSIKVKSINSLCEYIKIKAITEWNFNYNLDISYVDSKNSKVIQATDIVANAVYAKYNYNKSHLYNILKIDESIKFPNAKFNT